MYRGVLRSSARAFRGLQRPVQGSTRRFVSTSSPADKSRSYKNAALRWGAAAAAVYWYNTSPVFADEPGRMSTSFSNPIAVANF
jgi:mitochondrial intermembrane space import and assembly protein 40